MKDRKNNVLLVKLSIWTYMLFLMWVLFFFESTDFSRSSTKVFRTEANWIPLHTILQMWNFASRNQFGNGTLFFLAANLLGNIVLFVPFGIFMSYFFLLPWHQFFLYSLIFCFVVECFQYVFQLGVFDVDDILLNLVGANIGLCMSRILIK